MKNSEEIKRSLNLPALSQVGMVVDSLDTTIRYFTETLGLGPFVEPEVAYHDKQYYGEPVDSTWRMGFCSLGAVELEIIEPFAGPTVYHDFLRDKGQGIHHMGFDVPDMDKILSQCQELGIEIMQIGRTPTGGFAYLNTEEPSGAVFEIIQRKARRA